MGKYSNRGGRHYSIPVTYGDWVPINHAKALLEDVANKMSGKHVEESDTLQAPAPEADDRADHGAPIYIDTVSKNYKFGPPQRFQNTPRRHDVNHYQYQPTNNRRNNRKLPPPHFRGKPIHPQKRPGYSSINGKQNQRPLSGFLPAKNPTSKLNPFAYFDQSNLKSKPGQLSVKQNIPLEKQDNYLESLNAIQTIPAPDLSRYGPPIIELGTGTDGDIVVGRPVNQDHLAGFVSLDFDDFTTGQREEKKLRKLQEKQTLSILVGGSNNIDGDIESDLVNFLNNEGQNAQAYVYQPNKAAPKGFSKIDLPFMDPTKHKGSLPKAFIAPKGIPIPAGYKGKPLPPKQVNDEEIATETTLVIREKLEQNVEKLTPISLFNRRPTGSFLRHKGKLTTETPITEKTSTTEAPKLSNSLRFKLHKNRPSLTEFLLKNKKKALELERKKELFKKKEVLETNLVNTKVNEKRREYKDGLLRPFGPKLSATSNDIDEGVIHDEKNEIYKRKINEENRSDNNNVIENELTEVFNINKDTFSVTDNDPISIVFEPLEDLSIHSTLEHAESEKETSTLYVPTIAVTTTEGDIQTSTLTVASSSKFASTITEQVTTFSPTTVSSTTVPTTTTTTTSTSTTTTTTTTTEVISTTMSPSAPESTVVTLEMAESIATKENNEQMSEIQSTSSEGKVSVTTQDPISKLESLRKQKNKSKDPTYQGDLITGDDADEYITEGPESQVFGFVKPFRNRLRFKKFKGLNGAGPGADASAAGKFGKRLRSRKRPGPGF